MKNTIFTNALLISVFAGSVFAGPADRIRQAVDTGRVRAIAGQVHRLAQARFDVGEVDAAQPMNYVVLMVKPSAAQQADLEQLLADQQNPSSPQFRKWLTPEEYGNRFGVSASDQSKIAAWLTGAGLSVEHLARSKNWIAFSGSTGRVSRALHTSFHRFQVNGETHFANVAEPSVPEALADVVAGFIGLNDFKLTSSARMAPNFTSGGSHFMVPEDFATIYDIAPLYQAGIDGTGQNIAVVGDSDIVLSDLRSFRSRYGLSANDPKMILYNTDPGLNSDQLEANLDLEWAGAIAPKASITYVYGTSAFGALVIAVEALPVQVISVSFGGCEVDYSLGYYRAVAQQANAQGTTIVVASGDAGAAGCDRQQSEPFATRGKAVQFPAATPEVTGVGGTTFVEGTGNYWASTNDAVFGSALSYIPEAAWNESNSSGLYASGGGASVLFPKPAWQTAPGVPDDGVRHVPDIAFHAAIHDAYEVTYQGSSVGVFGTSGGAPSMAGIVALLNHYQVKNGFQKQPGLGNINAQLYRLAQSAPSVFHDVTSGNNDVPCAQGSPDCATGSIGYPAGSGYDMATGLGSLDVNALAAQWNSVTSAVTVTLSANTSRASVNDSIQMTATVVPVSGGGSPTGTVSFVADSIALGSAAVTNGSATVTFPLYLFGGTGVVPVAAQYSGDAAFSPGGAATSIQVTLPTLAAAIIPTAPVTVWPSQPDAQGLSWQTAISLREIGGVPALVTGFTIDGQAQTLAQYFPSTAIPPNGTTTLNLVFRNLAPPLTRTFGFTGIDSNGNTWSRQVAVNYFALPTYNYFGLTATPLTVTPNTSADPACQWAVQLNVDDLGGFGVNLLSGLIAGRVDISSQISSIFGTDRLDAWGGLQGTICFGGITPPATDSIQVTLADGNAFNLAVSFAAAPASPATLTPAPASITLAADPGKTAQKILAVNLSDKTQAWTASVFPANRTTAWLTASQLSGTGPATITLTASGTGFEPGVYRATIVLQSANAVPQYVNVPVMFVLGGSTSGTAISGVANAASYATTVSPGMLLGVFGTNLANTTGSASGNPLPYSFSGLSATVNEFAAPILYASSTFLIIQVPYSAGSGPAVLGVNNNGQIAGFAFQMSAASPGTFADASGNLVPSPVAAQGALTSLYVTGTGEVTPALKTAYSPSSTTAIASLPRPVLPLSVTVGGVPAFVQFAGVSAGLVGTLQVNIIVPSNAPTGNQPVVITVGGVKSAPVNIVVQAAKPAGGSASQ